MPEQAWKGIAEIDAKARPVAARVQPSGVGLLAFAREPDGGTTTARLKGTTSVLARVTSEKLEPTWNGIGWVAAMDCTAESAAAVVATLRSTGVGSDYRLMRSTNGGKSWEMRGQIPAPSLAQVACISANELWALGAGWLGVTLDGGANWDAVKLPGERNPNHERVVRDGKAVALLSTGLAVSESLGTSWRRIEAGGARVYDFERPWVAATLNGEARVGMVDGLAVRWTASLGAGREPVRITGTGSSVRVLSRAADPEQGVDLKIHRSEDEGKSFQEAFLGLRAEADVEGEFGLGIDLRNQVFGLLA